MSQTFDPQQIAQEIMTAQQQQRLIQPFSSRIPELDTRGAYEVGRVIHHARLADGALPVGRKIGFTNPAMWERFGVGEPIWSWMYDRTVRMLPDSQGTCHIGSFCQPKIEPELVVHLRDVPPVDAGLSDILACIDWIALGYEIVQCHYPGWQFQGVDTIIDTGLHTELVIAEPLTVSDCGPELLATLESFAVRLYRNDERCDQGVGANVMGSPIKAVAHLISVIAANPEMEPLQAGELITTGTLTGAWDIQPGEVWRTEVEGLALAPLTVSFL